MLSICIPVYNQNVTPLVKSLHQQAEQLGEDAEILLFDDASALTFQEQHASLKSLPLLRYRILKKNAGRSRIRNLLAAEARFEWLLFMDGDSEVPDPSYLQRYMDACPGRQVICGGRSYGPVPSETEYYLHWLYGTRREQTTAIQRSSKSSQAFMSNNFLIRKEIMRQLPFDEQMLGYGHEDTLFGFRLKKNGIKTYHIDNPLIHTGLESNEVFLKKSREAVANLLQIYYLLNEDPMLGDMVRLIRAYRHLQAWHISSLYRSLFGCLERKLLENLNGPKPSLKAFDLCKLGWLLQYDKQRLYAR